MNDLPESILPKCTYAYTIRNCLWHEKHLGNDKLSFEIRLCLFLNIIHEVLAKVVNTKYDIHLKGAALRTKPSGQIINGLFF